MCPSLDNKLCGHHIKQQARYFPYLCPQAPLLCSLRFTYLPPARQRIPWRGQCLRTHREHTAPLPSPLSSTQLSGLISVSLFQRGLPLSIPPGALILSYQCCYFSLLLESQIWRHACLIPGSPLDCKWRALHPPNLAEAVDPQLSNEWMNEYTMFLSNAYLHQVHCDHLQWEAILAQSELPSN